MTNRQVLEVKKNLIEWLLLSHDQEPEKLYKDMHDLLQVLRGEYDRQESFLEYECQFNRQ